MLGFLKLNIGDLKLLGFLQVKMVLIQQLAILAICFILFFALRRALTPKRTGKLPPGPKGKPIIGNLLDLPPSGHQECVHWLKHKEIYGAYSRFLKTRFVL